MILSTKNFKYPSFVCCKLPALGPIQTTTTQSSNLCKIIINRGLGKFSDNKIVQTTSIDEFRLITGQHPKLIFAKKSIAGFNLREKVLIGLKVTLRRDRMYSFLVRLITLALPQNRDFKGFSLRHFDSFGNYNFGISDQSIFPEIPYDNISTQLGFNVTLVFKKNDNVSNINFLTQLGFPFS